MTINQYQAQIDKNYDVAIHFYEEREKMFLSLYKQRTGQNFSEIIQQEYASFINQWQEYQKKIIKQVQNGTIKQQGNLQFVVQSSNGAKRRLDTGLNVAQIIGLKGAELKRRFAEPFENVLKAYFTPQKVEQSKKKVNSFILQHTGGVVQEGFTFKQGARMIRSDFTFTTGKNIPNTMELSCELDSNIQALSNQYTNTATLKETVADLLRERYLTPETFAAGFSVKNYGSNIVYTHSKVIQDEVNKMILYLRAVQEADITMKYVLSKHVIAITSPTVVGLMTTSSAGGFSWMSDLLQHNRYVMHLRKNETTGRFWIENSGIFLQNKDSTGGLYSTWNSGVKTGLRSFEFYITEKS